MTKQMPGWMLRDHANLADAYKQHIHDGGESALGDFLRDEAARREAEAENPEVRELVREWKADAPPPPAPDDRSLTNDDLRQMRKMGFYRWAEGYEALRAELDEWQGTARRVERHANEQLRRAEAAEAREKRLRDVVKEARTYVELTADHECGSEEGTAARQLLAAIDNALAQGGNDRLRDDNATARTADQMPGLTKLLGGEK